MNTYYPVILYVSSTLSHREFRVLNAALKRAANTTSRLIRLWNYNEDQAG